MALDQTFEEDPRRLKMTPEKGNYLNPSCRNAVLSRILTKMDEFKLSLSIFLSSFHLFATFVHTKPPGKSGNVVRWVEHLGSLRQQVL